MFSFKELNFHLGILIFVYIDAIIAGYTMKIYAVIKIKEMCMRNLLADLVKAIAVY